ncbi:MAG: anti-sigma factor [Bacteroidetes bacterium]|nr:anti-sigma factor [Bacteroidota bacterium]
MYKQKNIFLKDARRFVSQVKKAEQISSMEISDSWKDIKKQLFLNESAKKRNRYHFLLWSVAASLLISIFILKYVMQDAPVQLLAEVQKHKLSADSIREISLFATTDNHLLRIRNHSTITYQSNGNLTVNNKQIQSNSLSKINHLYVPRGKRATLILSDGTRMYVNAGSHIVFPSAFEKNKREIAVDGEIFLDVTHNPKRPFIVKTSNCDVRVLGTAFNVSAYRNTGKTAVVLVRGKVELKDRKNKRALLHPNQMGQVSSDKMALENVDIFKYICWKDNIMFLDNEKIGKVVDELADYYGIEVNYSKEISDIHISGKLDLCDSVDEVICAIEEISPVRMRKKIGNKYYFSKGYNQSN